MRINLFGNLRISFAGRPVTAVNTNRLHSLLAYLILHGDAPQPRERLAFLLWPASSESQARTNLRQLLHHLKRALPAECDLLVTDHFAVRWRQDERCAIDIVDFQAAIAEAASARAENDRAREIQSLTTAAQLYEDDLLPGLYDDWLTPLRDDYRKRISEVLQRLATLFEEQTGIRRGDPVRRTPGRTRSARRVAPSIADPAACRQSRPLERAARLSPVHARAAARIGCGTGSGNSRAVRTNSQSGAGGRSCPRDRRPDLPPAKPVSQLQKSAGTDRAHARNGIS